MQESRKLVIAVWQNIVFEEWLLIILGPTAQRRYQIGRGTGGETMYLKYRLLCSFAIFCWFIFLNAICMLYTYTWNHRTL